MTTMIYQEIVGFDKKTEKLVMERLLQKRESRSEDCYFDCVKITALTAKALLFDDNLPSGVDYYLQVSEERDIDCEIS